jgi:hypothetical protein
MLFLESSLYFTGFPQETSSSHHIFGSRRSVDRWSASTHHQPHRCAQEPCRTLGGGTLWDVGMSSHGRTQCAKALNQPLLVDDSILGDYTTTSRHYPIYWDIPLGVCLKMWWP